MGIDPSIVPQYAIANPPAQPECLANLVYWLPSKVDQLLKWMSICPS